MHCMLCKGIEQYLVIDTGFICRILLCFSGSLQVRYKLSKDGLLIFTIDSGNFANRELHHVKINREGRELVIQVCHGLC